ncbi:hypothetical protein HN903_03765 [archaeon]|jgi:hypothetical protein|nr:hypothetical protein [archaeon]
MRSVIDKRGQQAVGMSFGMIFAIFLIVVFLVIAGIAVRSFLDIGDSARVGMFYDDFQAAVDNAVQGQESDSDFDISLPSGIERVCFGNLNERITNPGDDYDAIEDFDFYDANVFLVPPQEASGMAWKLIERINVTKITATSNPYCVDVEDGLKIQKGFYDRFVVIA